MADPQPRRCHWVTEDPLYVHYHDEEWGRPVHDDRRLFEMLILEGAQAGLSWITVLRKRAAYRQVFHHFDPQAVAAMGEDDLARLLDHPGIIRNRRKIWAARQNARVFCEIQQIFGSFDSYVWDFVDGCPLKGQGDPTLIPQRPRATPCQKTSKNGECPLSVPPLCMPLCRPLGWSMTMNTGAF